MHYIQITPEGALPDVSRHAPFMAVIAPEEKLEDARQAEIARWLVDSGARYVLVCGPSASRWKEAVRAANLAAFDIDSMQPEDFVMITAHAHESLRGIYWHAKKHARHTHHELKNLLTIHISLENRAAAYAAQHSKA